MSYLRLGEDEAGVELISAEDRRRQMANVEGRPVSNSLAAASPAAAAAAAAAVNSSSSSSSPSSSRPLAVASSPAAAVSGSSSPSYTAAVAPVQFGAQPLALASSSSVAASGAAINSNPEGGRRQSSPAGSQVVMAMPIGGAYYPPSGSPASAAAMSAGSSAASPLSASMATPASMLPLYNDMYGPPPAYYFAIQHTPSPAVAPSTTVLMEGWLEKKSSGLIASWSRVFALLTTSHFSYYPNDVDAHAKKNLKNAMPLSLFNSKASPKDDGRKYCFVWAMKTDSRTWQFACKTAESRDLWIEKMNALVTGR